MRRTRHVVLPVKSWQYVGLLVVSLACLTLGLVSRDRGGRSESLAGPELKHSAPHEVDACPNDHPFNRLPHDDSAYEKGPNDNPSYTRTFSDGSSEKTPSMLVRERSSIRDRRSIIADRGIQRTVGARNRIHDSRDLTSISVRTREIREKPNPLTRAKRTDDRSAARRFSRYPESFSRDESSATTVNRQRRSTVDDRRRQETSVRRNANIEKQRLTSQSYSERREDRIARSQIRVTDTNRGERRIRSVTRDVRDEPSSRLSRSRDDRAERTPSLGTRTPEGRLTERRREDVRRATTTPQRYSVERRTTNQREVRARLVARSSKPIEGTLRSRSADSDRLYVERRERDSSERRNERTETLRSTSERNERRIAAYQTADRRVEGKRVQLEERSDRRVVSRSRERQARFDRRDESLQRKNDGSPRRVRQERERKPEDPTTTRRLEERVELNSQRRRQMAARSVWSANHRTVGRDVNGQRAWVDSLRRDVRSGRNLESRENTARDERLASRDVSRRRNSASSSRSFRTNSSGRRSLTAATGIGERRETSTERTFARELRTSSNERLQGSTARIVREPTSKTNSLQQRSGRTSGMSRSTESERPHRLVTRDRSTEVRPDARKLETPNEVTRETSATRKSETSPRSSRRDIRSYGTTGSRNREERALNRNERSTERSIAREIRERSIGAAIARTLRVSRGQDGVDTRGEGKTRASDVRAARNSHVRRVIDDRSRTVFTDIPNFANLREVSSTKSNDCLRQALFLVLCAIYGASMLKDKGGFYGFRKIIAPINRFVAW